VFILRCETCNSPVGMGLSWTLWAVDPMTALFWGGGVVVYVECMKEIGFVACAVSLHLIAGYMDCQKSVMCVLGIR